MSLALGEHKNSLRSAMRLRLAALPPGERSVRSRRILRLIAALPAWREATRVVLFAPLSVEPDTDLLWDGRAVKDKRCAYPRVEGATMRLYYINGLEELEPTRWGLREPPPRAAHEAILDDFDLVLVPGLAFDATGARLGRGGGFYDRLLAERDPKRTRLVGVGFAFQRIDGELPMAAHDMRLDEICTD